MASLPVDVEMTPLGLIHSIYGGGSPSRVATDWWSQPQGPRDSPPSVVTQLFTEKWLVANEPGDNTPQPVVSSLVTVV